MIEITETNETAMHDSLWLSDNGFEGVSSGISNFLESLTKEQRIALVEEIGLSVIEWVEFDKDDKSTYPDWGNVVLVDETIDNGYQEFNVDSYDCGIGESRSYDDFNCANIEHIKRWCKLTQRKES